MKLRKKLLIVGALLIPIVAFGTIQELANGDHIGVKSTDKLGFYGKTPVARPANTSSAFAALQSLGLIATGGTDPLTPTQPQHATISLASADLLALYSAPKLLVTAPGAGHMISVAKVIIEMHGTATAYITGGGAAIIQWDSTVHGGGTQAADSTIAATVFTSASATLAEYTVRTGVTAISAGAAATYDNKGIYLSQATGDMTAGTGTATLDIWYYTN